MMKKGLIIGLVLVVVLAGIVALWGVGVSNAEIRLANRGRKAMRRICWGEYTRSWVIRRRGGSSLKRRLGAGRRFWT